MHRNLVVPAILIAALLAGCSSLLPTGGSLDGAWVLTGGSDGGRALAVRADAPITLTIAGSEASGTAACNGYFGELSNDDAGTRLTGLGSTAMGCDGPVMDLETAYLAGLGRVTGSQRNGDRLTLTGPELELVYELAAPVQDAELVGTAWQLETVVSGDAASSAVDSDRVTMRFAADGTMGGEAGCTTWDGTWTDADGRIAVDDVTATAAPCASGLAGALEDQVTAVVDGGFALTIEGNRLVIEPERGMGLDFRAVTP
jgi:heat shock protein HslJ